LGERGGQTGSQADRLAGRQTDRDGWMDGWLDLQRNRFQHVRKIFSVFGLGTWVFGERLEIALDANA